MDKKKSDEPLTHAEMSSRGGKAKVPKGFAKFSKARMRKAIRKSIAARRKKPTSDT